MGKTTSLRKERRAHLQGRVEKHENLLENYQNFRIEKNLIGNNRKVVVDSYGGKMQPINKACFPVIKSWRNLIGFGNESEHISQYQNDLLEPVTKRIPLSPIPSCLESYVEPKRKVIVQSQKPLLFSGKFDVPERIVVVGVDTLLEETRNKFDLMVPIGKKAIQPREIEEYGTSAELLEKAKEKSNKQMSDFLKVRVRCCGSGDGDVELEVDCDMENL